jgi:hypothetical protein
MTILLSVIGTLIATIIIFLFIDKSKLLFWKLKLSFKLKQWFLITKYNQRKLFGNTKTIKKGSLVINIHNEKNEIRINLNDNINIHIKNDDIVDISYFEKYNICNYKTLNINRNFISLRNEFYRQSIERNLMEENEYFSGYEINSSFFINYYINDKNMLLNYVDLIMQTFEKIDWGNSKNNSYDDRCGYAIPNFRNVYFGFYEYCSTNQNINLNDLNKFPVPYKNSYGKWGFNKNYRGIYDKKVVIYLK